MAAYGRLTMENKVIRFNGQFSLLSFVAVAIYCWLVFKGTVPWWTFFIFILYRMNFIVIDLKKLYRKFIK